MNWHKLFFEFGGRIRRREFWAGTAILIAVQLVVLMPLADAYGVDLSKQPQPVWFRNIVLFVDIALAWPTMAVFAKRQHDRNQTAYLSYLAVALNVFYSMLDAFGVLQTAKGYTPLGYAAGLLVLGILAVIVVELGFRPGTPGPNDFGDEPQT